MMTTRSTRMIMRIQQQRRCWSVFAAWMAVIMLFLVSGASSASTSCSTSVGDQQVGIFAYVDPSCLDLTTVQGPGCFSGEACRYCKAFYTTQSDHLWPCPNNSNPTRAPSATPTFRPQQQPTTPFNEQYHTKDDKEFVIFYDDFDRFDLSKYKHEITLNGGGNWEFQMYRNNRTNSFVRNGKLHIRPTLSTDWNPTLGPVNLYGMTAESDCTSNFAYGCQRNEANPISSGRIKTRSFAFTTGRLEVRAKLPRGDWLWPAIWLLPKYEMYGTWPASGEIDVMEATGNAKGYGPGGTKGIDSVSSALHWGMDPYQNKFHMTMGSYTLPDGTDFSQEFHTFGLVRTPTGLYTYVDVDDDANRIMKVDWSSQSFFEQGGWDANHWDNPWQGGSNGAPFDEEFYLIINLAVGGVSEYFPDGYGDKPWSNQSPNAAAEFWKDRDNWYKTWQQNDSTFQIDSIKVTAL